MSGLEMKKRGRGEMRDFRRKYREAVPDRKPLVVNLRMLLVPVICGLSVYLNQTKEAVAGVTEICLNGGSCERSKGVLKMVRGSNTYILSGSFGRKFILDGCDNRITKNGAPKYDGPYDDGRRDTVDMESRCGKILGTKYYDDHTDEDPHKDVGEWKDGKKHGNVARYSDGTVRYTRWENDVYKGSWLGGGFNQGRFRTAEDLRQEEREQDARRKREAAKRTRNSRQQNNTSYSQHYDWIDFASGKFRCKDSYESQLDSCSRSKAVLFSTEHCRAEINRVCR